METSRTTPKDFFLYLFGAITLYISATTLVTLLWQLINRWIPDAVNGMYGYEDYTAMALRWSISVLIVVFPAYVLSKWWMEKEVKAEPAKRHMWIRRWVIWATLFVTAGVILGDLMMSVYTVLGGELAVRFFLKALVVGVVSAVIFLDHWFMLKGEATVVTATTPATPATPANPETITTQ